MPIIKKVLILLLSLFLGMMTTSCALLKLFPKPPEKAVVLETEDAESEKNSHKAAGSDSVSDAEKATVSEAEVAESEKNSHETESDNVSDAEKATVSEAEVAESEKKSHETGSDNVSDAEKATVSEAKVAESEKKSHETGSDDVSDAEKATVSEAEESPDSEQYAYKIGSGDILEIVTWKEPDFSKEIPVRIDGKITFPLLDDLQADGLTPLQLKKMIEEQLKEYVTDPRVTVSVKGPMSQKFYILGEVSKTGEYNLVKNLTILQAFALAGGFTEWASKKEIILVRHEEGKEKVIRINYNPEPFLPKAFSSSSR
ncbi:polysaccharide biosynthesis/export family protein [Desulfobacterales bacterium HSG2]|nr:polysaccharide biosynthesis/export family protein [Desulfobacterales bacterium HSG2]